jgi:hypothetical protein
LYTYLNITHLSCNSNHQAAAAALLPGKKNMHSSAQDGDLDVITLRLAAGENVNARYAKEK